MFSASTGSRFPSFLSLASPCSILFPSFTYPHFLFSFKQADRSADVPLQNPLRSLMWARLAGITGYYSISLILRAKGKALWKGSVAKRPASSALWQQTSPGDGLPCRLPARAVTHGAPVPCYPRLEPSEQSGFGRGSNVLRKQQLSVFYS